MGHAVGRAHALDRARREPRGCDHARPRALRARLRDLGPRRRVGVQPGRARRTGASAVERGPQRRLHLDVASLHGRHARRRDARGDRRVALLRARAGVQRRGGLRRGPRRQAHAPRRHVRLLDRPHGDHRRVVARRRSEAVLSCSPRSCRSRARQTRKGDVTAAYDAFDLRLARSSARRCGTRSARTRSRVCSGYRRTGRTTGSR